MMILKIATHANNEVVDLLLVKAVSTVHLKNSI